MFELVEQLTQVNAQILRALTPLVKVHNISVTDLIILWKINKRGSCKITELTGKTGLPASTLTSLFDRLEAKEFIIRIHDKNDRRSILVQGTPKLENMIDTAIENADSELISLLSTLPAGFVEHFMLDLQLLQKHLQQNDKS